jgi:hypothetical protein
LAELNPEIADPEGLDKILQALDEKHSALRTDARRVGAPIYAEGSGAFARRITAYWHIWKQTGR